MSASVEGTVCLMFTGYIVPKIVRGIGTLGLFGLLALVSGLAQIIIEHTGNDLLSLDCLDSGAADKVFASWVRRERGMQNYCRGDLRLKNGWHGLRFVWHPIFDPRKLRRIHRGHLNNRELHIASVMNQFTAQRVGEADNRVLAGAIGRLKGMLRTASAEPT